MKCQWIIKVIRIPPEWCDGMIKGFTKVSLEMMNVFTIFYTNSFIKTLTSWWHLMKHQGVTKVIIWFYLLGALDLSAGLNNQLENHIIRYKIFGMLPIIWHTFASRSNYTLSISWRLEPIHHPLTQPDPLRVITGGLLRLDNPTWKQITSSWGSRATAARQRTTRCPSYAQCFSSVSHLDVYSCQMRQRNWRLWSCELFGRGNFSR